MKGCKGICLVSFFKRVGCIQYDPLYVSCKIAVFVLQSRIDMSIKNLWWEDGYIPTEVVIERIIEAFTAFCMYLGTSKLCEEICSKIKYNF